jgi:putative SOS response-associated peptidase YedK
VVALSYVVEWIGSGAAKEPVAIGRADGGLLFAPALVAPSGDHPGEKSFAICTRSPNAFFARFHDRMIGVLTPRLMETWLSPGGRERTELLSCIRAPAEDELVARRVLTDLKARRAGDWSALAIESDPWKPRAREESQPAPGAKRSSTKPAADTGSAQRTLF